VEDLIMLPSVEDQVIDFFNTLFERLFSDPFKVQISDRLRRNAVIRQIGESADASSQSLTRFFLNQKINAQQVADILKGLETPTSNIEFDHINSSYYTPETYVDQLLTGLKCPEAVRQSGHDAIYRIALHSIVQVLMLVGPVMAEWQKLKFATTFELPRRIVNRLNQISEQMNLLASSSQDAVDERYELNYRDYLLQRFHRVEAGTVRMATNLDIDLRELFVMPQILKRPKQKKQDEIEPSNKSEFMDLAKARELLRSTDKTHSQAINAINQIIQNSRNVIVGVPGSGKSTFLEWLQVKIAGVEEEIILAEKQAIPLLLRVRQLDIMNLPQGSALIEKATASKDQAVLMPDGWIDRQMKSGRILFMLDGLDETEPELRDKYLIPWLQKLCKKYPKCHYLITSRPVGYPPGSLSSLDFVECDLLDFEEPQINEYTRHWSIAVRLAQNEQEEEARREGTLDGDRIAESFKNHPYVSNLARNPLMLSAICLVYHFENGHLPEDRALVYKLCVEGLLHNWDQRRGIKSDYSFSDKLRTCREVALAMQTDNRAEYEINKVLEIFNSVLNDSVRAEKLLEYIRYRTGLLIERRSGIFAFAHLTFQEYLAALAVHEGNKCGIDIERLISEVDDGRWQEVIPLYCGLATAPDARRMIERLIAQPFKETVSNFSLVLGEAYLSAGPEILGDAELRYRVLHRILLGSEYSYPVFNTHENPIRVLCVSSKLQDRVNPISQ
jgi:energy-coupling factor transporter ATP-binding protein EcfA2